MNGNRGYVVFFFPQALDTLGDAIRPYLQTGLVGPHVACDEIDTAGGFIEMTLRGRTDEGKDATLELMVPSNMVMLIVSSQEDGTFGFRPRRSEAAAPVDAGTADAAPAPPQGDA